MRGVIRALAGRLPLPPRRGAAPLGLLLLALAAVFVFDGGRGYLYRPGHHDFTTAQTMTVAANLSPDDGFQGCRRRRPEAASGPSCAYPYNAYPISPAALVRLATEAAGGGPARRLYAARLLMLAFFAGAAVLAWLALARLLGDRRIALAATLLAFSSYYLLYYGDMVSSEIPVLFGAMLAFHGMVLFAQEGRFRQLALKTAAALLLGWQVVGLIAPFVLLGLAGELARAGADGGPRPYARRALSAIARSPYLAYGLLASLCFGLVLSWAFANEYLAFGGERPLTGLRVFDSLARRSGFAAQDQDFDGVGWPGFLLQQLGAAGGSAIPFAFVDRLGLGLAQPDHAYWPPNPWFAAPGAAVLAACAAGLRFLPHRTPWAALLLAGWGSAILLRGSSAAHEHEAMFHLGAALVFWALALLGLRRLLGRKRAARALPAAALAAAAVFALSARDMSGVVVAGADVRQLREIVADLEAIRGLAAGRSVLVSPADRAMGYIGRNRNFYLLGVHTRVDEIGSGREWARAAASGDFDFVLAPVGDGGSLTPGNRRLHLYRPAALDAAWDAAAAREPALRAAFDLHLDGRTLTWTRDGCAAEDVWAHFFVEAVPLAAPPQRFEFPFHERGLRFGGRCLARLELPDYPLAGLRTGQRAGGDLPPVWEASLPVADPSFPRHASTWHGAVAASAPAARGPFAVYRDGRALTFARDGCAPEDTGPPFFVHARAADPGDLPEDRREAGFEILDFWFGDRGVRFGETCMARIGLPDYPLAGLRTGQRAGGLPPLWKVSFPVADPAFPRYASTWFGDVTASEPAARGPFAAYRDGRALTFVRGECSAADIADRFFVHAWAADPGDLPAERRAAGFEALDFWFGDRGVRFGGTCMARIGLPDYELRSVRLGQYDASGHLWDEEFALEAGAWLDRFASFAAREPDLRRAGFDLHLEGGALTFVRGECSAADVADRFFVHAYAPDGGREAIDFRFRRRGLRHGDRCMASIPLPDYPIARLAAGRYDASGHLWEAALALPPGGGGG